MAVSEKVCEVCGKTFECFQAGQRRTCSVECKGQLIRRESGVPKQCAECGAEFRCRPSMAEKRSTCSRQCNMRMQVRERMAAGTWKKPQKPRRGVETPCGACGKPVYTSNGQREKGFGRFCSYACHNAAQTKEPVVKTCEQCGKEMRLKPSQGVRIYCSKRCESDARIKTGLGRFHNGREARLVSSGYVLVWEPNHPKPGFKGWHFEHRIVMEKIFGRTLETDEQVHHKNGDKADNRPENLSVLSPREHGIVELRDMRQRVKTAESELEAYRRRFGPLEEG